MANSIMALSIFLITFTSFNSLAAIAPQAPISKSISQNSQIVNLNMQFKANNKTIKSELSMPFYQTAEFEKKIDKKNYLISVNPRRGKNQNEVEIEMRFFRANNEKAFAKKEIIAKIGEESKISFKGFSIRVTPILN